MDPMSYTVRRPGPGVAVIDLVGELTAASDPALSEAHHAASALGARSILLNFAGLQYMNSSGIGVLVTLLVRMKRQRQRLLAYALSDHYRQILELTRLDEAIGVHDDERSALAAAAPAGVEPTTA